MFCNSCGADIQAGARFCNKCGAAVAQTAGGAAAGAMPVTAHAGLSENAAAAIAYLTVIPAIVFLVMEPYNRMRLVRFHAWQCIGLCVLSVAVRMLFLLLHFAFWIVYPLISVAFFAAWIICIIKASQGQYFKLPGIGDFAEQRAARPAV